MSIEVNKELQQFLEENDYYHIVHIPGQGVCCLARMMFTTGLLVGNTLDYYRGRYCYATPEEAMSAIMSWDGQGDPPGNWIKYKGEGGDRSNPNRM